MDYITKKLFGGSYDDLWKAVIRPPKDEYIVSDLGPEKIMINNKSVKRTDIELKNSRKLTLKCSFWEPEIRVAEMLPCVIYLHGNSSSRMEAVREVKILLAMDITLFAFDFSGCGLSEGEYISLGYYERDDVKCVMEYLRSTKRTSSIGLWGRSMGAVTAIMYVATDPSIAGMVLDSPFSSLKVLVSELVNDKVKLPEFVVNQALKIVKSTVKKNAKFDLNEIEPIKFVQTCFIPVLFVHANGDDFIKPHHSKILFDAYPGDKNIVEVEGDHNSVRPKFFKDSAGIFFYNTLQVERIKQLSDDYSGIKSSDNKEIKFISDGLDNFNSYGFGYGNSLVSNTEVNQDEDEIYQKILELSKLSFEEESKRNQSK